MSLDSAAWAPWWSFTKTVLAASALALVARQRLALDEPFAGRPFTLRHLLQHRAGLPDYGFLADYHRAVAAGDTPWPRDEMLRRSRADTLMSAPGTAFSYSNIGYMFVGEAIQAATGGALGPALAELVLQPLGIADAALAVTTTDLDRTCWGNAAGYNPGWVYHGLLIGSAGAAALLLDRLLAGRLLPPDLLAQMRAALPVDGVVPDRPWRSTGYGMGLMIGEAAPEGHFTGHTGGGPGSTFAVYRQGARTAAAMSPQDAPGPVERAAMALARQ